MTDDSNKDGEDSVSKAETRGEDAGEAVARTLNTAGRAITGFILQFVYAFTRVLPKSSALWKNLMLKSAKAYEKRTGADAIALNARPNGTIDPIPVKWSPNGEKSKWVSKNGDLEWGPGSEGRNTDRLGKANVILVDEDGLEKWETLDARVAEAIELDDWDPLYTNPTIQKTVIDSSGVDRQAVADGGYPQDAMQSYTLRDRGELSDALIDISSGDGLDGMRVSWRKFKELRQETTTSEEMQRQEDRGRIAEMEGKEELAKKMLIIAGAIVVLSLAMAFVVPKLLASGGGGGGGGMISFYTGGFPSAFGGL